MILSFFFHHSNSFIHKPVTFRPRFKNLDTHRISVVNRLQLVIDLTDFLWNFTLMQIMLNPYPFNRQACGVWSNSRPNYEVGLLQKRFQLECWPEMAVVHRLQLDIFYAAMARWENLEKSPAALLRQNYFHPGSAQTPFSEQPFAVNGGKPCGSRLRPLMIIICLKIPSKKTKPLGGLPRSLVEELHFHS